MGKAKIHDDSNVGSNVTEIKDKDGSLLLRCTREYGPALSTAEIMEIETALLESFKALGK